MAGPDEIMSRGFQFNLPEWQGRSLKGLRVAVWKNDEAAPVAQEVEARVDLVAQALKDAGAIINEDARPEFGAEDSHKRNDEYARRETHEDVGDSLDDAVYDAPIIPGQCAQDRADGNVNRHGYQAN